MPKNATSGRQGSRAAKTEVYLQADADAVKRHWSALSTEAKLGVLRFEDQALASRLYEVQQALYTADFECLLHGFHNQDAVHRAAGMHFFDVEGVIDAKGCLRPKAFFAKPQILKDVQFFDFVERKLGRPFLQRTAAIARDNWISLFQSTPASWSDFVRTICVLIELALVESRERALRDEQQSLPENSCLEQQPHESAEASSRTSKRKARKKRTIAAASQNVQSTAINNSDDTSSNLVDDSVIFGEAREQEDDPCISVQSKAAMSSQDLVEGAIGQDDSQEDHQTNSERDRLGPTNPIFNDMVEARQQEDDRCISVQSTAAGSSQNLAESAICQDLLESAICQDDSQEDHQTNSERDRSGPTNPLYNDIIGAHEQEDNPCISVQSTAARSSQYLLESAICQELLEHVICQNDSLEDHQPNSERDRSGPTNPVYNDIMKVMGKRHELGNDHDDSGQSTSIGGSNCVSLQSSPDVNSPIYPRTTQPIAGSGALVGSCEASVSYIGGQASVDRAPTLSAHQALRESSRDARISAEVVECANRRAEVVGRRRRRGGAGQVEHAPVMSAYQGLRQSCRDAQISAQVSPAMIAAQAARASAREARITAEIRGRDVQVRGRPWPGWMLADGSSGENWAEGFRTIVKNTFIDIEDSAVASKPESSNLRVRSTP